MTNEGMLFHLVSYANVSRFGKIRLNAA